MYKFKVGDKVKIAKTSEFYGDGCTNPKDIVGKIIECKDYGFPYRVEWSTGAINAYRAYDLVRVSNEPKRHKPKDWVYKAYAMSQKGMSSLEISGELGVPDRTVRHNLQVHADHLKSTEFVDNVVKSGVEPTTVMSARKPTIFIIPDTQCKQGVDLKYMHWVGAYIKRKKPDIIVHVGDHYDMASLSVYDKGKLSAEGKRVKEDIAAGDKGIEILEQYISSVEGYTPRKVVTLGNHEDRIDRYVQDNPAFEGLIGTDKLAFAKHGWEVYPFLKPVEICGINFVHYIQNPMTGKPLGGTAINRLKAVGESYVMGHVQTYDFCQRPLQLSGRHQIGLIAGACYIHDEGYKGYQGNHHFRGCVMLYECADGYAMHKAITLQHMQEVYNRG